ncbi:MAG: PEGA domain-containing protein [Chitinispirillaceae bacterium]|nr:PEGA domain-containing protein [Chitinispirillaceae bacterium]
MENSNDTDLEKLFTWKPFPREIALMIALQALKILHFSHTQGKGHGAFESHAILVSKSGMVKVADSGVKGPLSDPFSHSTAGIPAISPGYLSPEAAKKVEKTDPTSIVLPIKGLSSILAKAPEKTAEFEEKARDIWSAGVLLYRILCGKLPFSGETVPQLLESIIYSNEQHILHYIPFLPDDCAVAISACLAKEPQNRILSLEPLITSLDVLIFDMGIRDIEKEIQRYMADKGSASSGLEKVLLGYHLRMIAMHRKSGDSVKAEAHCAEIERLGGNRNGVLLSAFILPADVPAKSQAAGLFAMDKTALLKRRPLWMLSAAGVILLASISLGFYLTMLQKNKVRSEVRAIYLQKTKSAVQQTPPALNGMAKSANAVFHHADPTRVATVAPVVPIKRIYQKKTRPVHVPGKKNVDRADYGTSNAGKPVKSPEPLPYADLKVKIEPSVAIISLDGKNVSSQEMAKGKRVMPGPHTITAWASGFVSYQRTYIIEPGVTQTVAISLRQIEKGTGHIHVYSYPWSDIYVDGVLHGTAPTPTPLAFPEGDYTLLLQRPGFKPYSQTVRILKGQVMKVQIQLEKAENSVQGP